MPVPSANPSIAVVIPVGPYPQLLDGCLEALRGLIVPFDEVIVVDDTADGSLTTIEGVRILRSHGVGPYQARNVGWKSTQSEIVFFCDVRCRPHPNWTSKMLAALATDGAVLVGSDVYTRAGSSLASRAAAIAQPFMLAKTLSGDTRPYFPNCNMAVRRRHIAAAGGFPSVRSGGDAVFCWTVQDASGGQLAPVHETLMDWIPRDKLTDFIEQYYRYGRGSFALQTGEVSSRDTDARPALSLLVLARRVCGLAVRAVTGLTPRGDMAAAVLGAASLAFEIGYTKAYAENARR